jgi:hypothetical protein
MANLDHRAISEDKFMVSSIVHPHILYIHGVQKKEQNLILIIANTCVWIACSKCLALSGHEYSMR